MAGRPGTLPWNMATFTGANPVTTLSDNFSFLNNQINDSGAGFTTFATDTGSSNNYIVTLASPPLAYEAGMNMAVNIANGNTGSSVINVNSLGNVAVVTSAGNPLLGGELVKNRTSFLVFDGTSFRILNHGVSVNLGSVGTNQSVECAGCLAVAVAVTFTVVNSVITLSHLAQGVPVTVYIANSSGSTGAFAMGATTPAGAAFSSILTVVSGGVGTIANILTGSGSFNMNSGQSRIFTGKCAGATLFLN